MHSLSLLMLPQVSTKEAYELFEGFLPIPDVDKYFVWVFAKGVGLLAEYDQFALSPWRKYHHEGPESLKVVFVMPKTQPISYGLRVARVCGMNLFYLGDRKIVRADAEAHYLYSGGSLPDFYKEITNACGTSRTGQTTEHHAQPADADGQ